MPPEEKRKVFTTQITDEHVFRDVQAGIDYLKEQLFVKRGRIALLFAAKSNEVGAVVPFYGTLRLPPEANRPLSPFDVVRKIKVPVQGHYALKDTGITQSDVLEFFKMLRVEGTRAELHNYEAEHVLRLHAHCL